MSGKEGIKEERTGETVEMLRGKKAVIFDLDGTLIDSMWLWKEIDVEYLGRFQIPYPEDLPDGIGGMSFSETAVFFQNYFQLPRTVEEIMEDWNDAAVYKESADSAFTGKRDSKRAEAELYWDGAHSPWPAQGKYRCRCQSTSG